MKKTTLMFFLTLGFLQIQAQDYLISFAGTGATTSVGSVKVDNLTRMTTVTLNGTDILHLTASLGIEDQEIHNSILHIYPNPMAEESILTFVAPENGSVAISIVDLSGKTVYKMTTMLSSGTQSFRVTGIRKGMFFLKVTGKNYFYSTKLICQNNQECAAKIAYLSSDVLKSGNQLKSTAATIDMKYTEGNQLLFRGISGPYSTVIPDVPVSSKTLTFDFAACTDADNNNYSIVQIGTQTWMAENLNVGVRVDIAQNQSNNGITEKYCNKDSVKYCGIYGGLYQWNEMMKYDTTPGGQGICPTGWHLPTDAEWCILTQFLDSIVDCGVEGESGIFVGAKLKSTGTIDAGSGLWHSPNNATNESGFSALPAGYRWLSSWISWVGTCAYFWSSSGIITDGRAWSREISYGNDIYRWTETMDRGLSVRCIRDY